MNADKRTNPIFEYSVHSMDSDNKKMKPKTLKNNLLSYRVCIFVLRSPSNIHKMKINRVIEPAFPGKMVCGRAIEKHKNQDNEKIILFRVTNLKNFSFIIRPVS